MKKTIKKRAFVSAIAMLIVSAIVLTSSTFAWFSMSKQASIETMNLTVSSPAGIQISANAKAWTSSLALDDIFNTDPSDEPGRYDAYEGNLNMWPVDLIPCSSALRGGNVDLGTAYFYRTTLDDTGYATTTPVDQTNSNNAGLISFDLFFKVDEAQTVNFGTSEFTDPAGTDILTSLRVAFIKMGNGPITSTTPETAISWKSFQSADATLYEPDSYNRSADAITSGAAPGKLTGANQTKYLAGNATGSVNSNYVLPGGTYAINSTAGHQLDQDSVKTFDIPAGITKMKVYIWVEGQDIDCRNSVAGAAFTAALKFTID